MFLTKLRHLLTYAGGPFMQSPSTAIRFDLGVFLILLALPGMARGSTTPLSCPQFSDYRILDSSTVLIQCSQAVTDGKVPLQVRLLQDKDISISEVPGVATVSRFNGTADWLVVEFESASGGPLAAIQVGQHYTIAFIDPQATDKAFSKVDIDSSGVATVSQDGRDLSGHTFLLSSHTAFPQQTESAVTIAVHNYLQAGSPLKASFRIIEPVDSRTNQRLYGITSPEALGLARFKIARPILFSTQVAFELKGLVDVLGKKVEPKPNDRVRLPQAPSSKALSTLYIKGDYAAATGSKPAWVLEGKLTPRFIQPIKGWYLYPDLRADIGNNSITNIQYTDTVDFGFAAYREDSTGAAFAQKTGLQHISTTGGFVFETDKELDKDNALGTLNVLFRFAHLDQQQAETKSILLNKAQNDPRNKGFDVKADDLQSPVFGYEADASFQAEVGSALKDTLAVATAGPATIGVPSYAIARIGPRMHGMIQLWNLSTEVTATGRYLAKTENCVRQFSNYSLALHPVDGWQGYVQADTNWAVDPRGHLALNLTYKNGFTPPKFVRVNSIQAGILVRY